MAFLLRGRRVILSLSLRENSCQKALATHAVENPEEYTKEPNYPPIIDNSYEAKKQRKLQAYHEEYKQVGTVEEKLFKLNLPKYYGYKALMLSEQNVPYNSLSFVQYATRTELRESETLPGHYKNFEPIVTKTLETIKSEVQDIIGFEHSSFRPGQNTKLAANIVQQINRLIISALNKDLPYLNDVEVDLNPRHEAFWMLGGIKPPLSIKKMNEGVEWRKKYADDPVDRFMQYIGSPYLAIRHFHPLQVFAEEKPAEGVQEVQLDKEVQLPTQDLDPRTLGYHHSYRHGTTIPGFWPGNSHEFGLLSYQSREQLDHRMKKYGPEAFQEALHSHSLQATFAWLFGQACYQGFSTYTELDYPLSAQTVLTNGKDFSFYAYQMNTILLHSKNARENPKKNVCIATKEAQLYQEIDGSGKVIGFNDQVLKNLINFYANAPQERDHDMKPYLDPGCPNMAEIDDPLRREFIETRYKHICANRPRYRRIPEIYLWEKIYKIDHNKRHFDKKTRPFELGINPFQRRLDDHVPKYVPRILRPGGYGGRRTGKSKEKWEKVFYPFGAKGRTPNKPNYRWVPLTN